MNKTIYPVKFDRNDLVKELSDALEEIISLSHLITSVHVARRGSSWTIQEQLCHAHSEISEAYEAIRQGNSYQHIAEELLDAILSAVTSYNVFMNTMWRGEDTRFTHDVVKLTVNKIIDRLVEGKKLPYMNPTSYTENKNEPS